MTPDDMAQRLLYRDGLMLIIDKPAGLSVHRGPKGGASLEDHFDLLRFGLPKPPALAHRLDKETSGCLVLGRHRKALAMLGDLFRFDKIGKTYWAVVEGGPIEDTGRIDLPLAKRDDNRGWWMKADPTGLPSETLWTVLGRAEGLTWLALQPVTGRTHQLRVHCAATGFPILGDDIYGNEVHTRTLRNQNAPHAPGPGLHLHARSIEVPLYKNKPAIRVTAPVPPHMRARLAACGWTGEAEPGTPA